MTTAVYRHAACARHDMGGGHAEAPARMAAVDRAIESLPETASIVHKTAPLAELEALKRVHDAEYVDQLFEIAPSTGRVPLDGDTALNPHSLEAAQRSAGAVIAAADAVMAGEADNAFCGVRPPGHHAENDRAMGFCFFGNVAVAAAHALANHGLERVAILDFDVHHGNGTQDLCRDEHRVLFCSIYENPLFPFTDDVSRPGRLIKSPVAAGAGRDEFRHVVENDWLPALEEQQPELILVSAGFDAHRADPLANLTLEAEDFAWLAGRIKQAADRLCDGRLVASLEGGYEVAALEGSTAAFLAGLA